MDVIFALSIYFLLAATLAGSSMSSPAFWISSAGLVTYSLVLVVKNKSSRLFFAGFTVLCALLIMPF